MWYALAFGGGVAATIATPILWKRYGESRWSALLAKLNFIK
jgi:hypothetical protein